MTFNFLSKEIELFQAKGQLIVVTHTHIHTRAQLLTPMQHSTKYLPHTILHSHYSCCGSQEYLPNTQPSWKRGVVSLLLAFTPPLRIPSHLPFSLCLSVAAFLWPPLSDFSRTRIDQHDIMPALGTVAANEQEGLMTEGPTPSSGFVLQCVLINYPWEG